MRRAFLFSSHRGGGGSRTEVAFGGRAHRWRAVVAEGGAGKHAEITKTTELEANRTLLIFPHIVEVAGVEPASKQGTRRLSTRLVTV